MITKDQIVELINKRKNCMLLIAQSSLPEKQYFAFRKLFLDEFGKSGLENDLERMFGNRPQKDR